MVFGPGCIRQTCPDKSSHVNCICLQVTYIERSAWNNVFSVTGRFSETSARPYEADEILTGDNHSFGFGISRQE